MPEELNQNQNQNQGEEGVQDRSREDEEFLEESSVGMPWKLMIFTLVLFVFSIFVYLGLRFGYKPYIEGQIDSVESQVKKLSNSISEGEKQEFLEFYSQLNHLNSILEERKFSQNLFTFLEENTVPSVYITRVEYSSGSLSLKISGQAESLKSVVDQVAIFENSQGVGSVVLGNLSLDQASDRVGFEGEILFKPAYLKAIQ